ncbi:glycosyltransferase family 2 protein [Sphingomonas oligoaromativorans]|uniref:glycosyltransferase family 2 protein n=1 Tax=Sphingomonas oligoaromativorans TaxID=575322 RepID=UPI0014213AF4|nr:glycosyltransferase family A protein [Sphingomonas oligoaromativorans]NIJ32961.1 glycosyltransferase involved in cell wall biosynthesis [Sphingomonas oligoaromativorans]
MSLEYPAVSVIMAAYNGAAFIRDTIDSVFAQTMADFEIVVVDDRSKDDTPAVLAAIGDPRLRVFQAERNGGPAVARTIAMGHARGRFIAGLDQDDLCRPDRFAVQLAYLDAHPGIALVGSAIEPFCGERVRPGPFPDLVEPERIDWMMTMLNPIAWSTVMMRGEVARALDPFERDEYRFAEDFDLYRRVRAHGRIGRIAEPLVRYRLHPGGASQRHEEGMIASAARVLLERYEPLFGDGALDSALLMSRYASARHAPPDALVLQRCGAVMEHLLATQDALPAEEALESASRLWWRMARTGLRAGSYGLPALLRAQPRFAHRRGARGRSIGDAAIGAARMLRWRR